MPANPFRRPFPDRPFGRAVLIGHGRTAIFVFLALLFLVPVRQALAYGLVTFLVAVAYSLVTERLGVRRSGRRWTMARWTLDQAVLLLLVSAACFLLYNYTLGWSLLNLRVLLYIAIPTVLVGLLPIVFSGVAVQLHAEEANRRLAQKIDRNLTRGRELDEPKGAIRLGGDAGATIVPGSIIFGVADTPTATRVRTDAGEQRFAVGLDELVRQLSPYGIIQCHADYCVNPQRIEGVAADAQGLHLRMRGVAESVPVSKPYFPAP
nr:LytTR family DNA-binding domain-containing protein [Lewinella sp. JB7]